MNKTFDTKKIYLIVILLSIVQSILFYILFPNKLGHGFGNLFFLSLWEEDPGHDFYYCMGMCREHLQYDKSYMFPYPPLHVFMYYFANFLSTIKDKTPLQMSYTDSCMAFSLNETAKGLNLALSILIPLILVILVIDYANKRNNGKMTWSTYSVCLTSFFSSGCFIGIICGNSICLTMLFTAFFLLNYNDSNSSIRKLSIISLAIAINHRPYVAIFFLLLLFDKRYKEVIKLFLISGLLFVISIFLLPGNVIKNFNDFLNQLFGFYGIRDKFVGFASLMQILDEIIEDLLYIKIKLEYIVLFPFVIYVILLLVASLCCKTYWKRVLAILLVMTLVTTNFIYILCFFSIPLAMFLIEENTLSKKNVLYFILFLIALSPYSIVEFISLPIGIDAFRSQCVTIILLIIGLLIIIEYKKNIILLFNSFITNQIKKKY